MQKKIKKIKLGKPPAAGTPPGIPTPSPPVIGTTHRKRIHARREDEKCYIILII